MWRYLYQQIVHRRSRALALGAGVLVATLSFTLLTSTAATSQLRVRGAVAANFRAAYDILVRPAGSASPLERSRELVQDNYLSGIYGGISFLQYRSIRRVPGVEVAAPIANIGTIAPFRFVPIELGHWSAGRGTELFRVRLSWRANGDLSRYPDSDQYVYVTDDRFLQDPDLPGGVLQRAGREEVPVCTGFLSSHPPDSFSPFQLSTGTSLFCFSRATPGIQGGTVDFGEFPAGTLGAVSTAFFPVQIAAIDPEQENRLVGFDETVTVGRPLTAADAPRVVRVGQNARYRVVPFLASTRSYVDEVLEVSVERLHLPEDSQTLRMLASDARAYPFVTSLAGEEVGRLRLPAGDLYEGLLRELAVPAEDLQISYSGYWQTSAVRYEPRGSDRLAARPVPRDNSALSTYYGAGWAPQEIRDVWFRSLTYHRGSTTFENSILGTPAKSLTSWIGFCGSKIARRCPSLVEISTPGRTQRSRSAAACMTGSHHSTELWSVTAMRRSGVARLLTNVVALAEQAGLDVPCPLIRACGRGSPRA